MWRRRLEFGFEIPHRGPLATVESISILARLGEDLGFDIFCVSDHIVFPNHFKTKFPYSESGELTGMSGECLEPLTLLSFLAAQTRTVRLLTSVLVLPYREPVFTAKIIASLDYLSGGRVIAGCGVGWLAEEFERLGAPPFEERGSVTDEYIQVFKELWTGDTPSFAGKYTRFSDITFEPKPVQKPHPPIWVGGDSPSALRRAALFGDGWYPTGVNSRYPVGSTTQLSSALDSLRRHSEEAGRNPDQVAVACSIGWYDDLEMHVLSNGERRRFTGSPHQIAGDILAYGDLGVRCLILGFERGSLVETTDTMERFARDVLPLVYN